jgi:capsular polysaccharide biosynthesis protein
VALLAAPEGKNYYHWLFDSLPRHHLLEKYRQVIELYAIPSGLSPVQIESLRLLNVGSHQIVQLNVNSRVRCEHLYAPSLPGSEGCTPPWVIKFLRERLLPTAVNTVGRGNKIYVERGGSTARPIINEPDLIAALTAEGFIAVKPESLTFQEQVALYRDAQVIVAAHGAGLANLVFSNRAWVLEIFSGDYIRPDCYFSLCRQLGHSYDCWTDVASIHENWGATTVDIPVIIEKIKGIPSDYNQ